MRHQICISLLHHVQPLCLADEDKRIPLVFLLLLIKAFCQKFSIISAKLEISSFGVNRKNNIANYDSNYLSTCVDLPNECNGHL